jgi:phosphoribosylaminoimidazolecarboxamide formyltransferase/IMP cyclohydrolase
MSTSTTKGAPKALLSVTDKTGIVPFARGLIDCGFDLLSTGGTAKVLTEAGLKVTDVATYTGSPEIMQGRVKTLHPKVHGGILFDRQNQSHIDDANQAGIEAIDLVVVNLYQFAEQAVAKNLEPEKAIEYVDIGGPTMLRAAAKNWQYCLPVIDPLDYDQVLSALRGTVSKDFRISLAAKVFSHLADYNQAIGTYLGAKERPLRYGENPHQTARFRGEAGQDGLFEAKVLQGKELSYNNILDLDSACSLIKEFNDQRAVAVIKHTNPCGCAASTSKDLVTIYGEALAGDPQSAFGGIIATNQIIDAPTAEAISKVFTECIAAPGFSADARDIFAKKKNLRLLEVPFLDPKVPQQTGLQQRSVRGGTLIQDFDSQMRSQDEWQWVTKAKSTDRLSSDLLFAMRVCKHVKSNAIVFAKDGSTVSVGAGQMSRVDSANFAAQKAKENKKSLEGTVLASDAFFPFGDTVELAASLGVKAIIQPGGSMRDQESIDACDKHSIAMAFTGLRHFKH